MLKSAAVGLIVLGATSVTAVAGDWNNGAGSYKDMRGSAAVPVPAPTPIPQYSANWYMRLDAGLGFNSGGDISESGMLYGLNDSPGATGPEPFGSNPAWFNSDFDTFGALGGGVGYYWSDRIRTDITLEVRTKAEASINGSESYTAHYDNLGVWTPDPNTQVNVYMRDVTSTRSLFSLVNAYYDFGSHRGFSPYVGAGIGISYNELSRQHNTAETTCDPTTSCTGTEVLRSQFSAHGRANTFSLAAALTAGMSYSLSDITALDFNYRMLYIGGSSVKMPIVDASGNTLRSNVSLDSTLEHQLRAGLRFNIN